MSENEKNLVEFTVALYIWCSVGLGWLRGRAKGKGPKWATISLSGAGEGYLANCLLIYLWCKQLCGKVLVM